MEYLNLRDLSHFMAIAEAGQVNTAAQRIGITQPALTKSLQRFESATGSTLFRRTRKGLVLTQAGALVLSRGKKLLQGFEGMRREISDHASGHAGELKIGAGPTMTEYLIPKACTALLAKAPGLRLKITTALNDILFTMLQNGDLDLVVSGLPEKPKPDFEQTLIMHDAMLITAHRAHPLAKQKKISLTDLSRQSWVLPPHQVIARRWLEQRFQEHGLPEPRVAVEANSAMAIMAILADSKSLIGFHPKLNIQTWGFDQKLTVLHAPEAIRRRAIGITWKTDHYMPQSGRLFIEHLRMSAKSLNEGG